MKSILVQLDDATYEALKRVAPSAQRRQSRFIREAVRKAVRDAEYRAIREAYAAQPDVTADADDWSSAEEYAP